MPKRTDANQTQIVKTLRKLGASVLVLSGVGHGCPDILAGYRGQNVLIEIKDGSKPPSGRKLTEHEQAFFDGWRGQVDIVKSEEEAVALVGKLGL